MAVLSEAYIYPAETRPVRDLLRKRSFVVRQRTANILSIQNLFSRNTSRSITANGIDRLTPELTAEMGLPTDVVVAANASLAMAQCSTEPPSSLILIGL